MTPHPPPSTNCFIIIIEYFNNIYYYIKLYFLYRSKLEHGHFTFETIVKLGYDFLVLIWTKSNYQKDTDVLASVEGWGQQEAIEPSLERVL